MSKINKKPDSFQLVNSQQAAEMLGISLRKLWSMKVGGEIPHVKIGKSVRFHIQDLYDFAIERKRLGETR